MKFLTLKTLQGIIFSVTLNWAMNLMAFEINPQGLCEIEHVKYPAVGFGTYPLKDEICSYAVEQAIEAGYRIIDTATFYKNFIPIGKALKKFGRHNFYIISKVWPDAHTSGRLRQDLQMTLQQLETDYLDTYLLHWPNSKVSIEETLDTMNELRKKGLIRHIGLSNVTVNHLKRALELNIPISWVQVEMHPLFYDPELLKFCHENSITVQAWAPLARGRVSTDSFLATIGEKYGKTPSQIAIRWIIQHGCIPLPGSKSRNHIRQNMEVMDFVLTQEEMDAIDERAKAGERKRITEETGLGFTDEFDFSYEECWPKK